MVTLSVIPLVSVHMELKSSSPDGYLSITDFPLLPFYSVMCGVYVVLGLAWLTVCSLYWREILRLQFWIGGVILMGMVEKAMFTAEYQNIHNTGQVRNITVNNLSKKCFSRQLKV